MEIMRNSQSLHLFLVPIVFSVISLLPCPGSASSGSDFDYGAHPRFVCTPIPMDADPSCFPKEGPGVGAAGTGGTGHQSAPPAGWWGGQRGGQSHHPPPQGEPRAAERDHPGPEGDHQRADGQAHPVRGLQPGRDATRQHGLALPSHRGGQSPRVL
ncbi:neuronal pentraxin-1-like isoform X1 [Lates japonicus]